MLALQFIGEECDLHLIVQMELFSFLFDIPAGDECLRFCNVFFEKFILVAVDGQHDINSRTVCGRKYALIDSVVCMRSLA